MARLTRKSMLKVPMLLSIDLPDSKMSFSQTKGSFLKQMISDMGRRAFVESFGRLTP